MGFIDCCLRSSKALPIFLALIGLGTIITTLAMTITSNVDVGGIVPPYISDTGTVVPQKYIFAVGLTFAGGAVGLIAILNHLSFIEKDCWNGHARRCIFASTPFGIVASLGLAGLAILDTRTYESLHLYAALSFFVCVAVFITLNTVGYSMYRREDEPNDGRLKKSVLAKTVLTVVFWLAFVVYIPIGLGVYCYTQDPVTLIYDYTCSVPLNTMRTVSQYTCVATIMLYFSTFALDLFSGRKQPGESFQLA